MKLAGFVLIGIAIIGALLAYTNADGYNPRGDFAWNLSRASVPFGLLGRSAPCPRPDPDRLFQNLPSGCPYSLDQWSSSARGTVVPNLPLGTVIAGLGALALVGIGLLVFNAPKRGTPAE